MPDTEKKEPDEEEWEYGDVWEQGSPDDVISENDVSFVEIFRTDTGMGYNDTAMLDFIGYLGSRGIRATYDSFSLGLEHAAFKTYVLKVEAGKVDEAMKLLRKKLK